MPRPTPSRISRSLPPAYLAGGVVLSEFCGSGLLDKVDEWMPLSRRGGHQARSLFAFLVPFLMAGAGEAGIRPFVAKLKGGIGATLAGLADVEALPSSAAISRALGDLTFSQVEPFADRLLAPDAAAMDALSSPHVLHRDAHGLGWHVLDLDPTNTVFRIRNLPHGAEYPVPERLAEGAPGHVGQKRGELRVRHVPILHAGLGLWLGHRVAAAHVPIEQVAGTLCRLGRTALRGTRDARRVIARADGEFGSVGSMLAFQRAEVDFVTRLSRYKLLETEEAQAAFASPGWRLVGSSASGPERHAAELGSFRMTAAAKSAAAGEEITARVVAVRRACPTGKPSSGTLHQGWQVDLFVTSLDPAAWPAEAIAELYAGRASLENRFAQEDREFGLERTFSYSTPGQAWVVSIGLHLWNTLILRGLRITPLPTRKPAQSKRLPEPAPEPVPPSAAEEMAKPPVALLPPVPASVEKTDADGTGTRIPRCERELWQHVAGAFQEIHKTPGWRIDSQRRVVVCPNNKALRLATVNLKENRVLIQASAEACTSCAMRDTCIKSTKPGRPAAKFKALARTVSAPMAARMRELWQETRGGARRKLRSESDPPAPPAPNHIPPPPRVVGPLVNSAPLFLPAESRKRAHADLNARTIVIVVSQQRRRLQKGHPLLAKDAADRQHRRHTHNDRRKMARIFLTIRSDDHGASTESQRISTV